MLHQIEIITVPSGGAPLEIREVWVGMIMPVNPLAPQLPPGQAVNVVTGERSEQGGFMVNTRTALYLLESKDPQAAKWWWDTFSERMPPYLVFESSACNFLEGPLQPPCEEKTSFLSLYDELLAAAQENSRAFSIVSGTQQAYEPEAWEMLATHPVDRTGVMVFAEVLAGHTRWCLDAIGTPWLYEAYTKDAHQVLQNLHTLAVARGVRLEMGEVDIPITYTDVGVAQGLLERVDGFVVPTEEAKRMAAALYN